MQQFILLKYEGKNKNYENKFTKKTVLALCLLFIVMVPLIFLAREGTGTARADSTIHHYLYVFPDQTV
jgi:hypothetical protein